MIYLCVFILIYLFLSLFDGPDREYYYSPPQEDKDDSTEEQKEWARLKMKERIMIRDQEFQKELQRLRALNL